MQRALLVIMFGLCTGLRGADSYWITIFDLATNEATLKQHIQHLSPADQKLFLGAFNNDVELIKQAQQEGANVEAETRNAANPENDLITNPLHIAVARGNIQAIRMLVENLKADALQPTLQKQWEDVISQTPIQIAVETGNIPVIDTLIELNPHINLTIGRWSNKELLAQRTLPLLLPSTLST
jgi:ankyrin repeat protein